MDATPCQITEFFNGTRQMLIPLFQRTYEWKNKHWTALWEDILDRYEVFEDRSSISHFTGALVMTPARSVPVGVSKFLVIDGQQRLTTIAVLLCAIRSFFTEKDKLYRKITKLLLNEDEENLDLYKILPTQPDRPGFFALIHQGTEAAESSFKEAFNFFRKMIDGKDSDGMKIDVTRLFNTVQTRVSVVSINLGEDDDPYLIFESLNAKGSPLSQSDLVRNYLLLRIPAEHQQEVYDKSWLPMQQRLNEVLPEFIRQYLVMSKNEDVRKGDVYAVLKRHLGKLEDDEVPRWIANLERFSVLYKNIIDAGETHPELARRLGRIQRWELNTSHPLLLKLYDLYVGEKIDVSEFCGCLVDVESFVVRRTICGVPTNQLKRHFIMLTKTLVEKAPRKGLAIALMSGQYGRRWPKDDEFEASWKKYRAYTRPIDRCRFILESIERSYDHKEPASFENATIEHVLPQTLSDDWRKALGDGADEQHEIWVHTIGNLTLSGYNSEISNAAFEEKKKHYATSNFKLNDYFTCIFLWSASSIQTRADVLLPVARTLWPYPAPPAPDSPLTERSETP